MSSCSDHGLTLKENRVIFSNKHSQGCLEGAQLLARRSLRMPASCTEAAQLQKVGGDRNKHLVFPDDEQ